MKLFEVNYEELNSRLSNLDTQEYLKHWTKYHQSKWQQAQDYVENIRQAQQAASLKAIKEVIS